MSIPVRTCVACRQRRDKPRLIRLVSVAGTVNVDAEGRLPGRGAYVCRDARCLDAALQRGRLHRALRRGEPADAAALRSQFKAVVQPDHRTADEADVQLEVSA